MNKQTAPNPIPDWTEAPAGDVSPVPGYEAWLKAELAAGMADLEQGRSISIDDLRRELGLE